MKDLFHVQKIDIKLQTLPSWKVQKISNMLQDISYILFMLPTIKTEIKNGR